MLSEYCYRFESCRAMFSEYLYLFICFSPPQSATAPSGQGPPLWRGFTITYLFIYSYLLLVCRSQWPRRLRHRSAAAPLLRLWVRIPPGAWMPVSCECCVLTEFPVTSWSLVQRSSTDFGGSCVWSRNLMMVRPWPALGGSATGKKKYTYQSKVSDKSIHEIVSRPPQDSLMTQILGRGP